MQDSIEQILERVSFEKKDKLQRILSRSMEISEDSTKRTTALYDNVLFKMEFFLSELEKLLNDVKKVNRFSIGMEILTVILEELGFEFEKEDAFIVYHLRGLGKFKIKDTKLRDQLKGQWGEHKEYILTDQEFSRTLKVLMRMGIIDYRKGNLTLKKEIIVRYKN